jgi:hypothetical protein
MPERVVDHLQIVEIEHEQRPALDRPFPDIGQCRIEGGPVGQLGQCVGKGAPLMFDDAIMAVNGDQAEMQAMLDEHAFERRRPPRFAVVKGKGRHGNAVRI